MTWGAIGGAAISLVGGALMSDASGNAVGAQTQASQAQIDEAKRQYDLTRSDQAPFRNTGVAGNKRLAYLLGLDGGALPVTGQAGGDLRADPLNPGKAITFDQFQARFGQPEGRGWSDQEMANLSNAWKTLSAPAPGMVAPPTDTDHGSLLRKFSMADRDADPVYQSGLQFGLDQGRDAINARAIQAGGYDSGATLKALTRYGNDYGSTKANESYNRFSNDQNSIYNKLAGISGAGQQATNQIQAAGANASGQIQGAYADMGNSRAAGIVGGARAWGDAGTNAFNNWQSQSTINKLMSRGGGGYSGGTFGGYGGGGSTWWGDNPEY